MRATKGLQIFLRLLFVLWPMMLLGAVWSGALTLFFWISLLLFILRLVLVPPVKTRSLALADRLLSLTGIVGSILCLTFQVHVPLLWYPVAVNVALFFVFFGSVLVGRPIIETFARLALKGKTFPPEAVRYTRKVTFVWMLFFVLNGTIATFTAIKADTELWTLWNGCLSYLCIGLVAGGEYLVRRRVCKN
ncbi:MAG TPA: DNA gyrase subunit B [Sutterella sp.]|nr:DNA gyrase subunit B [Sutterella sp.]